jgi:hypothetical protein
MGCYGRGNISTLRFFEFCINAAYFSLPLHTFLQLVQLAKLLRNYRIIIEVTHISEVRTMHSLSVSSLTTTEEVISLTPVS